MSPASSSNIRNVATGTTTTTPATSRKPHTKIRWTPTLDSHLAILACDNSHTWDARASLIREAHFPGQTTWPTGNACRKRWDRMKKGKKSRGEVAGVEAEEVEVLITVDGQMDGEEGMKSILLKKGGEEDGEEEVVSWKGFVERGWVKVAFAKRG